VDAIAAAAALAVTDDDTEAQRAEYAAVLAAAATPVKYGSFDEVPMQLVDISPQASCSQQQPA